MLLFELVHWKMGASWLHQMASRARRKELTTELHRLLGSTVLAGPFKGMVLPEGNSWRDGDFIPKLIGTYESNLRQVLSQAIESEPTTVINVGCAEGYYAVGLARTLPNAAIYAFDLSREAGVVCTRAAAENGVGNRVTVGGQCTPEHLSKISEFPGQILLVMDCEGAERELLDPAKVPGLLKCDVIVETHSPAIVADLEARFQPSHDIEIIAQGGRDPNELKELKRLPELERWLLIDEGRPESMVWMALWAK